MVYAFLLTTVARYGSTTVQSPSFGWNTFWDFVGRACKGLQTACLPRRGMVLSAFPVFGAWEPVLWRCEKFFPPKPEGSDTTDTNDAISKNNLDSFHFHPLSFAVSLSELRTFYIVFSNLSLGELGSPVTRSVSYEQLRVVLLDWRERWGKVLVTRCLSWSLQVSQGCELRGFQNVWDARCWYRGCHQWSLEVRTNSRSSKVQFELLIS